MRIGEFQKRYIRGKSKGIDVMNWIHEADVEFPQYDLHSPPTSDLQEWAKRLLEWKGKWFGGYYSNELPEEYKPEPSAQKRIIEKERIHVVS